MRDLTKDTVKDAVSYFYLISRTATGTAQTAAEIQDDANDVTRAVRNAGGKCRLFSIRGAAFDYVSMITGISAAASVEIKHEIEKGGAVKATLVSGVELFNEAATARDGADLAQVFGLEAAREHV